MLTEVLVNIQKDVIPKVIATQHERTESHCEKCERDIKQLRIELDALRSEMTDAVGGDACAGR